MLIINLVNNILIIVNNNLNINNKFNNLITMSVITKSVPIIVYNHVNNLIFNNNLIINNHVNNNLSIF